MKTIHDIKWIMKQAWKLYRESKKYATIYHKEYHKSFSECLKQAWKSYFQLIDDNDYELEFAML